MRVRFPWGVAHFNNFFSNILILTIMKEAFKKIEDLAKELNGSVKPGVGGGYIIIASGNSADEDSNTISVMNGHGVSLLDMMTRAFIDSPDMRQFAKAAAIAADTIEASARRREKETIFRANHEPADETACDSGEPDTDAE